MTGPLIQCEKKISLKEDYKYCVNNVTHDSEGVTQMDTLIRKQNCVALGNNNDPIPLCIHARKNKKN